MSIQFTKMHGLGNDFMVIDLISQKMPLDTQLIQNLANRHFGVGFDQMLIVEAPNHPDVDFKYRIFNADGSEVAQCGNGARCFARFVRERGLTKKSNLVVETNSGIIKLYCSDDGWVKVNMGAPKTAPADIPFLTEKTADTYQLTADSSPVTFDVVNMGNPHAVIVVEDILTADVHHIGRQLEVHPSFPERVNVGFMQVMSRDLVRLRVFERGAGETLACGTGACAAVVSGIRRGLLDSNVHVQLQGGSLHISWQKDDVVWMTGPTATVFQGEFELEDLGSC